VKCGKRTEKIESVSGPFLKKCPHCGGKVERVQSAPAIQFKGSGWYVTDYAGKSSAKESGSSSDSGSDKKDSSAKDAGGKESSNKDTSGKDSGAKESTAKESSKEKKTSKK
jgi:putative FmdB family regulatory protein